MNETKYGYTNQEVNRFKDKVKNKMHDVKDWIILNRETIIFVTPIVMGIAVPVIKGINKRHTIRKARDVKELYCYDRSLGHYWSLRRELSNDEWITIDRRKKCGERLADILSEMKVLK